MIFAALTLASALTVASPAELPLPPAVLHEPYRLPAAPIRPPQAERTPNLYRPPGPECRPIERKVLEDQKEQLEKLGRLPKGSLQYAVLRQIDGCGVPAPVGYHPPALPGAADVPPLAPVTREGEPSRKR